MTASILLTGGTGTLGRRLLPLLREAGYPVRVLSRNAHPPAEGLEYSTGDLATGAWLDTAMTGIDTVVHCAGSTRGDDLKARNLVRAATSPAAGGRIRHLVYISVVGCDRIPVNGRVDRAVFGYFAAKLAAERIVAESGIPWTTLRATQFHDLTLATARQMARMPVIPVPTGLQFQPIDTGEVAERMAELARGEPAGLVPDLAGPRAYTLDELIRGYLRAAGRRRPIMPVAMPGAAARAIRAGAALAPDRAVGRVTWEDFLAAHVPPPAGPR